MILVYSSIDEEYSQYVNKRNTLVSKLQSISSVDNMGKCLRNITILEKV